MNNKNKGLASLAGMAVVTLALVGASDPIYNGLSSIGKDGEVIETKAAGFGGDVVVQTTVGDDGSIKDVQVIDCSTETDTIGQAAAPEIAAAIVEAQDVNVDVVAGATMTSTAIKTAVAEATGKELAAPAEETAEEEAPAEEAAEETAAEETAAEETTEETEEAAPAGEAKETEASAAGFGGDVTVSVSVNEEGKITSIKILDYSSETPDVGQAAAPEVTKQIMEAQSTEVDGVAGATMTSNAIKEAVQAALDSMK